MAERDINSLDGLTNQPTATAERVVVPVAKPAVMLIEVNYPEPTLLSLILKDVARWSGHAFVMEPALNTRLQIFAPHKLETKEAYEVFLASLSVAGLRAVQSGGIVKIVAAALAIGA